MQPSYRDEVERRTWQNPEVVLADAGIKAGDIFIDLACGFGFFALPAARMVGSQGIVCGLDIDEEALKELREKAVRGGLRNLLNTGGCRRRCFVRGMC
ncbi:MAG TPA: methyltransferase domain-containing protein [Candidatus Bathyarchaeia archaeon]|nr:methyltransferase domain-containing protein [Candidatus Bathyarchaeia archaeon]